MENHIFEENLKITEVTYACTVNIHFDFYRASMPSTHNKLTPLCGRKDLRPYSGKSFSYLWQLTYGCLGQATKIPSELKPWNSTKTNRSAWAMKLLTTRPSSIFMRGPYVLKIRAIRISVRRRRKKIHQLILTEIQETRKTLVEKLPIPCCLW